MKQWVVQVEAVVDEAPTQIWKEIWKFGSAKQSVFQKKTNRGYAGIEVKTRRGKERGGF